ncbi:MAG: hypothetical protein ACLFTB_05930 [Desulfovibrionales bacterium]
MFGIFLVGLFKVALLLGWEEPTPPQTHGPSGLVAEALAAEGEGKSEATPPEAGSGTPAPSLSGQLAVLREKEQSLDRREQELSKLEQQVDAKLTRVAQQQEQLQALLEQAEVLRDKKLKHLVDVYSNMKAKQAAEVLETLDETIAVKILSGMRGRTAGEILTYVNPRKAATLSAALTHVQLPGAEEP